VIGTRFKFEAGDDAFYVLSISVEHLTEHKETFKLVDTCFKRWLLGSKEQ
jgi:hypothetical protein